VLAGAFALATAAASGATDSIARIHAAVTKSVLAGTSLPSLQEIEVVCGKDSVCAASMMAAALGDRAFVARVDHPDTDTIRLVKSQPSVIETRCLAGCGRVVILRRFGRTVKAELRTAVGRVTRQRGCRLLVLDFRGNEGGPFEQMLAVAGMFVGNVDGAIYLVDGSSKTPVSVSGNGEFSLLLDELVILVDGTTASSAEILAALLRQRAGAKIVGKRTFGKDYLLHAIPVSHDLELVVPGKQVVILGETMRGGIEPDGSIAEHTRTVPIRCL
jgi:Peptidase family S41